ncbi:hypothetical protein GCM10022220_12980 [Actinocatenispora rupis]|uniref:Uncharacterized protein n=1 Tax=Actinocatenispora rupis TaxID=519421 RepID=A0A8J3J770_9ACTN|nr:hypothetical protein Aru02nite_05970 [Actinocatenispora rupis]
MVGPGALSGGTLGIVVRAGMLRAGMLRAGTLRAGTLRAGMLRAGTAGARRDVGHGGPGRTSGQEPGRVSEPRVRPLT